MTKGMIQLQIRSIVQIMSKYVKNLKTWIKQIAITDKMHKLLEICRLPKLTQ